MNETHRMRCAVTQIGARRHYAIPRAFAAAGRLERFFTDFYAGAWPWRWLDRWTPELARRGPWRRLSERRAAGIDPSCVRCCRSLAWRRLLRAGRNVSPAEQYRFWVGQNQAFGEWVGRQSWGRAEMVYALNGAAVEIFREAKRRGVRRVLDQTLAPLSYVERVLAGNGGVGRTGKRGLPMMAGKPWPSEKRKNGSWPMRSSPARRLSQQRCAKKRGASCPA
jgi:hypothetical protein